MEGEDVAGGLLGGVGGGEPQGRGGAVGGGGVGQGHVCVVGVDLDHGFVEDLDYLLELACGEGQSRALGGMGGGDRGVRSTVLWSGSMGAMIAGALCEAWRERDGDWSWDGLFDW